MIIFQLKSPSEFVSAKERSRLKLFQLAKLAMSKLKDSAVLFFLSLFPLALVMAGCIKGESNTGGVTGENESCLEDFCKEGLTPGFYSPFELVPNSIETTGQFRFIVIEEKFTVDYITYYLTVDDANLKSRGAQRLTGTYNLTDTRMLFYFKEYFTTSSMLQSDSATLEAIQPSSDTSKLQDMEANIRNVTENSFEISTKWGEWTLYRKTNDPIGLFSEFNVIPLEELPSITLQLLDTSYNINQGIDFIVGNQRTAEIEKYLWQLSTPEGDSSFETSESQIQYVSSLEGDFQLTVQGVGTTGYLSNVDVGEWKQISTPPVVELALDKYYKVSDTLRLLASTTDTILKWEWRIGNENQFFETSIPDTSMAIPTFPAYELSNITWGEHPDLRVTLRATDNFGEITEISHLITVSAYTYNSHSHGPQSLATDNHVMGYDILLTPDNHLLIAGYNETLGMYLFKSDLNRIQVADTSYGGRWFRHILPAPGGGYFACTSDGGVNSRMLNVAKLDDDMGRLWHYRVDPDDALCNDLIATSDGGMLISSKTYGYNQADEWIVFKINAAGQVEWKEIQNSIAYPMAAYSAAEFPGGLVRVAGVSNNIPILTRFNLAGRTLTNSFPYGEKEGTLTKILNIDGDNYLLAGAVNGYAGSDAVPIISKLNSADEIIWNLTIEDPGYMPIHLKETPDGNYLVLLSAGSYSQNPIGSLFIKFDPAGNIIWKTPHPLRRLSSFAFLPDGTFYSTGQIVSRLVIARFGPDGIEY